MLLEERIVVPRRVEDCYRYLSDFSTIAQWDPGVCYANKLTPGAVHEGSEFMLELKLFGRRIPMQYRMLEMTPNRCLVLYGEGDQFSARDTIEFVERSAEETEIRYQAELDMPVVAERLRCLLQPFLNRYGRHTMAALKRALTPEPAVQIDTTQPTLKQRLVLPAAWEFTQRGYRKMPNKGLTERIDGQVVVVTGATSGLGFAAACELSRLGADLHLVGRDERRMQKAVKAIQDFSGAGSDRLHTYTADLCLLSDTERVAQDIRRRVQHIDVLINNAGALYTERELTVEGHERSVAIHCLVPAQLMHSLQEPLRGGQVINVLSGGLYMQPLRLDDLNYSRGHFDGAKAYARAKRALLAWSESWAADFGVHGVRVNTMHPGWANTPGVQSALPAFHRRLARYLRDSRMGADTMVWLATASAAQESNGHFWFDRKAQPTAVLPGTAHSAEEREDLRVWLNRQLR